ncbi:T9SS sorting signal type C domain-containing protein [Flavobacterium sp. RSB2_4_14]|uniref:T9SS sorting signal type C domain-containing protein n=1 Tax=Flavobacterium sp. RSB2_4_14 TaxID=3447665 RepID=UPI003F2A7423
MKLRLLLVAFVLFIGNVGSYGQTLYDSFADGDFSVSPVWGGNTTLWGIQPNSDAAAGSTGSNTLRLNALAVAQTDYLSSQISSWSTSQEWGFWLGRRAQALTAANQAYFWLYANEANLNSATVDGYRIAIGDDTVNDEIRLEYILNGAVSATVITSTGAITNGRTDFGLLIRVTRSSTGTWEIFTSTLPAANGVGAIATEVPNATNANISQGTGLNNTLVPVANGYIGVAALHSTGANAITSTEFDQIYFTIPTGTPVITLADNGTQITSANVAQGTTNHILSSFQTTVASFDASLTTAAFATSGTYLAADIAANGFTLWRNSTANDFATATAIGTLSSTSTGSGDILIFSLSPTVSLPVGTSYFWVTATIAAGATAGNTIRIDAIANADLTFSSGTKSGSASVAGFQTITLTPPAVPGSLTRGCTTNTTQVLNWTAPATGSYDGYLLVVRQGAVPNAVTSIYVPTQTTNLDYTLAPTYNATTSRVLYKTTAAASVSVTVTGLTAGLPYTFAVYAYKNNGASTLYSATATTTTPTINLPNVTSASTTAGNASASLSWVNPNVACFDQVLVVVTATPGITFVPTGSTNTAYTPNTVFAGFNQAVYYSSGNLVNITGLTNGTTYYLEIFVRNGSEWSSGVEVSVTPLNINPTVLKTGDLVLIAYDNNLASTANDGIRLLTMVDINPGTRFLWTNATYETGGLPAANVRTDKWFSCITTPDGNVPFLEFTYNGGSVIPAASTFCIETISGVGTGSTITAVTPGGILVPNTSFSIICKTADGSTGLGHGIVNVSTTAPDSMFLLQGNFIYDVAGSTFVGTVLSGVQDGGLWYDLADDLSGATGNNLRRSRKHPKLLCASLQASTVTGIYRVSYDVSVVPGNTTGTKQYLLGQILNYTTNWIPSFGVCPSPSPFSISVSDTFNRWTGGISTNWFDCNNWAQLSVPDEFTDVVVFSSAARDAIIDFTAPFSDTFSDIAKTRNLTISGRKVQVEANINNKLEVYGDLLINFTGVLDMDDGTAAADGNLYLYKNFTNSLATANFLEGNGTVSFVGSLPQVINNNVHTNPEDFFNVILDNDFATAISNNLIATGDLEVKTNKFVTIGSTAFPNDYIRVNNRLTNNGDVIIETGGQLIQVNEPDTNTGDYSGTKFTVKRDYTARDIDYVYWGSPTKSFAVNNLPNGFRYEWNPVFPNSNGTFGNWIAPSTATMTEGKGYIARTFNGSSTPATNTFTFRGQPNNGVISIPISRGNIQGLITDPPLSYPVVGSTTKWDDNWNLVGNPYPSAINSLTFLLNANNPDIEGFVYVWSHGTVPSAAIVDPFYDDFAINYTSNDYIIYNGTGTVSGPTGFNGMIASGQGFFVLMKDGPAASGSVNFNNSMRRNTSTNATYNNTQFYRNASVEQTVIGEEEKSRIWLDIVSPQNAVKRTLIGYVETASNEKDRLFDAVTKANSLDIYSFITNDAVQEYCIQGRALPFINTDTVALGIKVATAGTYKIAISALDGLFEQGQPIFLEDKVLNIIHDLRVAPYSFTVDAGRFDNRFILRYTSENLGNPDFETLNNSVVVATNHGQLTIKSFIENMQDVTVYDILGRQLFEAKGINNTEFVTSNISMSQQTLIVKIRLKNGVVVTRKIVL